jgi:hypothetical protein
VLRFNEQSPAGLINGKAQADLTFVIVPMISVSPDCSPDVSSNSGPTSRDIAIRVGSSIAVLNAVSAPTSGTVIIRMQAQPDPFRFSGRSGFRHPVWLLRVSPKLFNENC